MGGGTKRSIHAEKSAPLATSDTGSSNTISPPQVPSSASSSTIFQKVGRSAKKHSLDEDFLNIGGIIGITMCSKILKLPENVFI